MTYADTSALVKLLIAEAESKDLAEYLSTAQDRTTSSQLAITELMRTVARRGGRPASARMLLQQLDLLAMDEAGLWRAGRIPTPGETFLRSADAIHVIAAMELGESEFLTYDRRQAQAAAARGFTVIAPGRPDDWYAAEPA